eukprot:4544818-Amphidinium_carterae.1
MTVCDRCSASTRLQEKAVFVKRHRVHDRECAALYATQDKLSRLEKRAIASWAGTIVTLLIRLCDGAFGKTYLSKTSHCSIQLRQRDSLPPCGLLARRIG